MEKLYIHNKEIHNFSAAREIVPLILKLAPCKSVIDVGCGTGTWLKVFNEHGIEDILGIDGEYVDRKMLEIHQSKFSAKDLRGDWSINRKFDLVLSLEVAEHLPEETADNFVRQLTSCGELIIFSAAIPMQGGQNHINEQWPRYWQEKFRTHGWYMHDLIRPQIWNNEKVEWWYRQNIFVVSRVVVDDKQIIPVIHPELFYKYHKAYTALTSGDASAFYYLRLFWLAIKRILKLR